MWSRTGGCESGLLDAGRQVFGTTDGSPLLQSIEEKDREGNVLLVFPQAFDMRFEDDLVCPR
jgi:hypothetical protein